MSGWVPQQTADGSYTFFSDAFGEAFHSHQGAKTEAVLKFAVATGLAQKAQGATVRLLDVCYGLGYNTAAALEVIWGRHGHCRVELYGLELDPTVPTAATAPDLLQSWSDQVQESLKAMAHAQTCQTPLLDGTLLIGDARQTIQTLIQKQFQADAIFLDPFSPRRCPQLWTVEFFQLVGRCLAPDGLLATYSRSAAVRSALKLAGLCIGTIPPTIPHLPHEWAQGTVAAFDPYHLQPLSQMEQEHLQTRAAIPYRDPGLSDPADVILQRHQQEQQSCQLESTSSWRRRWKIR